MDGAFDHVDTVNGCAVPALIAAVRRRHGNDDDGFISPTSSVLGRAGVLDRVDRAKGMPVLHGNPTDYLHRAITQV